MIIELVVLILTILAISAFAIAYKNGLKESIKKNGKKVVAAATAISIATAGLIILPNSSIIASVELIDSYSVYERYGYDLDKIDDPVLYKTNIITEGHLPLAFTFNTTDQIEVSNVEDIISHRGKNVKDMDILKYRINALRPYEFTYEVSIYEYETVEEIELVFNNETGEYDEVITYTEIEVFIEYESVTETRYKWKPVSSIKNLAIQNEDVIIFDIVGNFNAQLGHRQIDIIPKITIGDYEQEFPEFAWWNSDWTKRIDLYVDSTQVLHDLTNFPVLVFIDANASLYDFTQADMDDLAFVDTTNVTQYNHQIESIVAGGGVVTATVWVNLTSVSSSSNTHFNMYYSNAGCGSQQNLVGTWNDDYKGIWHLNETAGNYLDSTIQNHDGILVDVSAGSTRGATGIAGECIDFEGDLDYIALGTNWFEYNTFTLEMYINYDGDGERPLRGLWRDAQVDQDIHGYNFFIQQDSEPNSVYSFQHEGAADYIGAGVSNTLSTWTYYAWNINDSGQCFVWKDGDIVDTDTLVKSVTFGTTTTCIALYDATNRRYFDGDFDEVRYSDVYRNFSWTSSSYNTINNQTGANPFILWGEVSTYEENQPPELTNPYPPNESECINCTVIVSIDAVDPDGDLMNLTFRSNNTGGAWIPFGTNNSVGNGTYSQLNLNFSECNTTFYWNVTADDGTVETVSDTFHFTTIREPEITVNYPANGSSNIPLQPTINVTITDPCSEDMDVYWHENSTGVWLLVQTNLTVNNGTFEYDYVNASVKCTRYWYAINVSNSCCLINETFWFDTECEGVYNVTVRTNDTGFFCFRGFNTTAANFTVGNFTGFDEADEYISVFKNDTWDTGNWMWTNYYGDDSGVDFVLNRFDVVRVHFSDSDDTTVIWMNDTEVACNCSGISVGLKYSTNRGYNYTCFCINITGTAYTTLKAVAIQSPVVTGQSVAWWNNSSYKWEVWIVDYTPDSMNHNIYSYSVFETKVAADRTWVMP